MLEAGSTAGIEEIVDLLFDLTDHMRARFSQAAAYFELSPAQARALLRVDEPVSMRQLAQRLRCDASNVTGIVASLEERGLVVRQTSAVDRRVRSIAISEKGARLREELRVRLGRDVPAIGRLSAEDRAALHDILTRAMSTVREW
jgi:DNA-binding MarR family transcriptional regulator